MIKSITMKNVATYDNVGVVINNLHKVNFIYGANASGKTTISDYISEHEENKEKFKDCMMEWEDGIPMPCYVYNKKFREANFGETIPGVFSLGKATKKQKEEIDEKTKELEEVKKKGIQKKSIKENQEKKKEENTIAFQGQVWVSIYKKYENDFSEAFIGSKGSKKSFAERICNEYNNNKSELKTYQELSEKANIIFGKAPQRIDEIESIEYNILAQIEEEKIWNKKIIGKADVEIAKLINRLNISDWVSKGKTFLEEGSDVCPFCQQHTINDDFKKQIESFFDESYLEDSKKISDLQEQYNRNAQNIINSLQAIEDREKINEATKLNIDKFSTLMKTLYSQIVSNREMIDRKIKEPSRGISLMQTEPQLDEVFALITKANEEIRKHNNIVQNYQKEKDSLKQEIWKFLVDESKNIIEEYIKKQKGLQKGIDNLENETNELRTTYLRLDAEIKELNKNVTSVQPSVDEINRTLQAYGFLNFYIRPTNEDKNMYQIQRGDNTIAKNLSEGEVTFITFLYYLQLVKGGYSPETVSEKRIIVVDDPISSLDSNVLFVVSSLLKDIIKDIRDNDGNIVQIILLTHNVYFHKEVSFVSGRNQPNKENSPYFWILRKKGNVSNIQSFEENNPIQNSYELLWQEIREKENLSSMTIQNTMRRILEMYFKILGGLSDDDIINKFENLQEKEICRSLLCWINDGSHCIPDSLFIEQQDDTIESYLTVFKKVFEKSNHISHYNMMMKIE